VKEEADNAAGNQTKKHAGPSGEHVPLSHERRPSLRDLNTARKKRKNESALIPNLEHSPDQLSC
jgi:hypothetical protein